VVGLHERHEYQLHDEASQPALLVHALSGGSKEWHLFRPAAVPSGMTPYEAATKGKATMLNINGRMIRIVDLFRASAIESAGTVSGKSVSGAVQYGFVATEAGNLLVARWSENQIQFLLGTAVPEADAAFGRKSAKP
jgi:hypothetical protein